MDKIGAPVKPKVSEAAAGETDADGSGAEPDKKAAE